MIGSTGRDISQEGTRLPSRSSLAGIVPFSRSRRASIGRGSIRLSTSRPSIDAGDPIDRGSSRSNRPRRHWSRRPERFSVEVIVEFAWAIKTAIKYHRVFTNERGVQRLQTRRKPWNAHEEPTVQRFGDRGPPDTRILSDAT